MVGPAFVSSTGRRGRVVTPFLAAPGAPDELGGSSRAHRVALVSSSYFPHPGGVEQHVRSVAGELRARGHDVVVWTVDRGEGLGVQVIDGVEVRYLPSPLPARSLRAVLRFLLDLPAAARAWWRAYRGFAPSVLHVQCFGPNGLYALLLAHLTRTPLVLTSHGETFADDHRVFDRSALIRTGMRKALRLGRGGDGVLAGRAGRPEGPVRLRGWAGGSQRCRPRRSSRRLQPRRPQGASSPSDGSSTRRASTCCSRRSPWRISPRGSDW